MVAIMSGADNGFFYAGQVMHFSSPFTVFLIYHKQLFESYYTDTVNITKEDMISFLMANSNYKVKDTLADCEAKVLVLVGSREQSVMKKSAQKIADCLPMARLEVMKNYYHGDISINHSEQYVEKLLHLINS